MKPTANIRWPYLLIIFLTVLLLFHAQFSFCQSDESFYLATINRLYNGEHLLIDEWHPTQFYAPIFLPLYCFYRFIFPSGEYMILFFRVIYILSSGIICLLFFSLLKERCGQCATACAAILCLLYSRANISGLSYYNFCLLFSIAFFLCITAAKKRNPKVRALLEIFSGIIISWAVLCLPYLAFIVVIAIGALITNKKSRCAALSIGLGIISMAVLYILINFDITDMPQLVNNFIYVLKDPQHTASLANKCSNYMPYQNEYISKYMILFEVGICALFVVSRKMNRKMPEILWWVYIVLMVGLLYTLLPQSTDAVCYVFLFPFSIYMFPFVLHFMLTSNEKIPILMYFFGLGIAVAFFLASNTGIDAMTSGYCLSSAASILTVNDFMKKNEVKIKQLYPVRSCFLFLLIVSLLLVSGAHRFLGIYRDAPLDQLTVRIEEGPAKGLLTTEEHAEQYNKIYSMIRKLAEADPDARVFHSAKTPWAYLCANWEYGAPTSWTTQISSSRLKEYYQMHPEKYPDYVFIYEPEVGEYKTVLFNNHKQQLTPNENDLSGPFYDLMQTYGEVMDSNEYVTVYRLDMDGCAWTEWLSQ